MAETVLVTQTVNDVKVTQDVNKVVISTPGPQGPSGRTILNGQGSPANNLGREGDFYYDKDTTIFYGPKLSDATWAGATSFTLNAEVTYFQYSWEVSQLSGPSNGIYSLIVTHNLNYNPNVTVKNSAGDILETGIEYNNTSNLTLTMAQPFSGTAYLS